MGAEKEWPFCVELRGCGNEGDPVRSPKDSHCFLLTLDHRLRLKDECIHNGFEVLLFKLVIYGENVK